MNIIFVLYHNFLSNSAIHVHNLANALTKLGCNCAVAVPDEKETSYTNIGGEIKYHPLDFRESLESSYSFFKNGKPDVIYAWTPREIVRKQCEKLKVKFKDSFLLIHLEDNEEVILESNIGLPLKELSKLPKEELEKIVSDNLSHPINYKKFLESADGVSVIMDTLLKFVPRDKPKLILWPIVAKHLFLKGERSSDMLRKWGIAKNEIVVAYIGNVHNSNWREVRSLYLAVALANRQGIKTRLIRTGKDYYPFWGLQREWAEEHTINLGFLPYEEIPRVLANADILIQPGKADRFNDYRLPSKIPEFLSTKKPVAIPNTNIGRFLKNGEEALILKNGDSLEILSLISSFSKNRKKMELLGIRGQEFAKSNFDEEVISQKLYSFIKNEVIK